MTFIESFYFRRPRRLFAPSSLPRKPPISAQRNNTMAVRRKRERSYVNVCTSPQTYRPKTVRRKVSTVAFYYAHVTQQCYNLLQPCTVSSWDRKDVVIFARSHGIVFAGLLTLPWPLIPRIFPCTCRFAAVVINVASAAVLTGFHNIYS